MKVISPNNTTHNFKFVPRFNPSTSLTLTIKKEGFEVDQNISNTYTFTNGYVTITFDLVVVEGEKYSLEIKEGASVIYKGKLFVTSQNTQQYKQTKDIYVYE